MAFSGQPVESGLKFFDLTVTDQFSGLPVESALKFFDLTVTDQFSGLPVESALKFFDLTVTGFIAPPVIDSIFGPPVNQPQTIGDTSDFWSPIHHFI